VARTGSESFSALEKEIAEISGFLWERGWAECNAGNLSVDITPYARDLHLPEPDRRSTKLEYTYPSLSGQYILITISGRRFRDCARDVETNTLILRISEKADGYEIWGSEEDDDRPTSELLVHLRIHEELRSRKSKNFAVLHTHPTHLIALSHVADYGSSEKCNAALWAMHPEVKVIVPKGVKLIPYVTPGSEALARATAGAFGDGHAVVVWQYHGAVAVAPKVDKAFDLVHTVDKAAQMVLLCRSAGSLPTGIGKPELDELVRIWNLEE
jgi:rhamnulose-1-phosphate aldolase